MQNQYASLMEMAQGAFKERVDYELARVVENILDLNTNAVAKRKIQVNITLIPDKQRQAVQVQVDTTSKLAPVEPVGTTLMFQAAETGELCLLEVGAHVPGQMMLDGSEQEPSKIVALQRDLQAQGE